MTARLACLHVPLFSLAARLRSEPELGDEALAVTVGDGAAARIVAASRRARAGGIRPGQTLAQARARLPRLLARARDAECEEAAQASLLEAAEGISPRLEDGGPGLVYADLEGLERHYPDEAALGEALVTAAREVGLTARVGIAGSKLAARVAASQPEPVTVVPPRREAVFLAPLPLSRLSPEAGVASTLDRWGVRSIGELARLPADEVASRLGKAGRELHAVARGEDPRPLVPRPPTECFREGATLEWPLVSLEPFLFVARSAMERLCRRLESRGLGCERLVLALRLDPEGHVEHQISLPSPSRDPKSLLTLVRLRLEAQPTGAPITAFTLAAYPDRPPEAQLSLFGPDAISPGRLAATLGRLFALVGPDRVGSPEEVDGHRPELFRVVDFDPPAPPKVAPPPPPAGGRGLLSVQVLRPPVALDVVTDQPPVPEEEDLREMKLVEVRSKDGPERRPRIRGRVRAAAGPWALEEEWWSESPAARDYWDVELSDGGLYRLYRERGPGRWYADGIYD